MERDWRLPGVVIKCLVVMTGHCGCVIGLHVQRQLNQSLPTNNKQSNNILPLHEHA